MAEHTFTAFKWTGTYYNSTYNTSYTATLKDNDGAYEGSGDGDELVSIDGGPDLTTSGSAYAIDVNFRDTAGDNHVETFNFFRADGDWYFIPGPDSKFGVGAYFGTYQSHTVGWNYADVVCFASGTLILTDKGERPVENLRPGDRVFTLCGAFKTLRMNLGRAVSRAEIRKNPKLAPVVIAPDALGPGYPRETLRVSRQHRMLVSSKIARRMFGTDRVLVAANKLVGLPGVTIDLESPSFSYFHLVFDDHELILANGAPTESFFPGPQALKMIPQSAREEFHQIFGANLNQETGTHTAAFVPEARKQRRLVDRHMKNKMQMVQPGQIHS